MALDLYAESRSASPASMNSATSGFGPNLTLPPPTHPCMHSLVHRCRHRVPHRCRSARTRKRDTPVTRSVIAFRCFCRSCRLDSSSHRNFSASTNTSTNTNTGNRTENTPPRCLEPYDNHWRAQSRICAQSS
jgi:hypothetical protein